MKKRTVKRILAGAIASVTLLAVTGCGSSASSGAQAQAGEVLGERTQADEAAEEDTAAEADDAKAAGDEAASEESKKITVGVCAGPYGDMFEDCITPSLEELGYEVEIIEISDIVTKEGKTSPPKRYTSGSMILAMENAGQLIEDEELRAQIKGSGIGTSATRAEILNKLIRIEYIAINKKTQILTPTLKGEVIYEVVNASIRGLLNPELTASWEKGLTGVAEGTISEKDYIVKLEQYIRNMTNGVKNLNNSALLENNFRYAKTFYGKSKK